MNIENKSGVIYVNGVQQTSPVVVNDGKTDYTLTIVGGNIEVTNGN